MESWVSLRQETIVSKVDVATVNIVAVVTAAFEDGAGMWKNEGSGGFIINFVVPI